jgi:glucosylceramidase
VLNADASNAHTFNVDENGQYFTYTLPAKAVATFTWKPSSGGGSSGIDPTKWYQVVNTNSGDCVDAANGGTSNGTAVQQWACAAGNINQQWQFQPTDSGYYKVVTRNAPALAWDVTNRSTANGTQLQQWACTTGDTSQAFQLNAQ